jgi:hypothetical protein
MMKLLFARPLFRIAPFPALIFSNARFCKFLITIFVVMVVTGNVRSQSDPIRLVMEDNHLNNMEGMADETHIVVWGKVGLELTKFVVVNRATKHVTRYQISSQRFRFAGVISTPEDIKLYIETKMPQGYPRIELLTFVKKDEYFQQKVFDRENYIASFAQDGKFYRIAVDKKNDALKVVTTNGTDADKVMTFPTINEKLEKILRKEDFEFIPQGHAISYENGRSANKIYVRGDILYLVSDGTEAGSTGALAVMALDMNTGKADLRTIPWLNGDKQEIKSASAFPPTQNAGFFTTLINAAEMKHNSFLLADQLFVFCFDNETIALSIHDIKTGAQTKLLQYPKGTPVAFKSSDLMQDGESLEADWTEVTTEKARATKILKTLNKGEQPFIMVEPSDANFRLIVGSEIFTSYGGGTMMMSPGSTISTPRGTVSTPGHMMPSGGGGSYVATDRNYFYGYLTSSDLTAAPQSLAIHGPVDALNKRFVVVSKEMKAGKSGIVYDGTGVLLVYVNKKTKEMVIEKI